MKSLYRNYFKRILGFTISLLALLCLCPLLLVVTIWLHFANKGAGAFFFQERPGMNGKIFKIIKFKSMTDERDVDGHLLPDAQRLTKIGSIVRKASIDELPQLFNVLKGDMALIGPRPLLPDYMPYYTEREQLRHTVRPGITGWAQVHGRNHTTWDEKLENDAYYVEHMSFLLDCKIILTTIKDVVRGKGIDVVPAKQSMRLDDERKAKGNADKGASV
jgi:lipopolysaccharide/colanic/teichoic acid biosynthesis glycosyltransferase